MKWERWGEEARDPPSPRNWQRPRQGAFPGRRHFQAGAGSSWDTPTQGWGGGERSVAKPHVWQSRC